MKKYSKLKNVTFFLILFMSSPLFCTLVNPMPGENLWHLTAAIGTVVDELALEQVSCCSKIDRLIERTTDQCDLANTFSAIAATIQSKIDECCACNHTPIFQATTITASGTYCLANNISGRIVISADQTVVDLNQHTITNNGSIAITISSNVDGITIQNGYINSATTGISASSGNSGIIVNNVSMDTIENGISLASATQVNISNVDIRFTSTAGSGIQLTNTKNINIAHSNVTGTGAGQLYGFNTCNVANVINCTAKNISTTNTIFGFNIVNCIGVNLNSCTATSNSQLNNIQGFSISGQAVASQSAYLTDCTAINCALGFNTSIGDGVYILESCLACQNNINYGLGRSKGLLINCTADGGNIGFTINDTSNGAIINCQAIQCAGNGFSGGDANSWLIKNCNANKNSSNGFSFSSASSVKNAIENCTATNNTGTGFVGTGDNRSIFYENQASGNIAGNYLNVVATPSANIRLFTNSIISRVDNVRNIAP